MIVKNTKEKKSFCKWPSTYPEISNFIEEHDIKALDYIYKTIQCLLRKALWAITLCLSNQHMSMQVLVPNNAVCLTITTVPWGPFIGYLAWAKQQLSEWGSSTLLRENVSGRLKNYNKVIRSEICLQRGFSGCFPKHFMHLIRALLSGIHHSQISLIASILVLFSWFQVLLTMCSLDCHMTRTWLQLRFQLIVVKWRVEGPCNLPHNWICRLLVNHSLSYLRGRTGEVLNVAESLGECKAG